MVHGRRAQVVRLEYGVWLEIAPSLEEDRHLHFTRGILVYYPLDDPAACKINLRLATFTFPRLRQRNEGVRKPS